MFLSCGNEAEPETLICPFMYLVNEWKLQLKSWSERYAHILINESLLFSSIIILMSEKIMLSTWWDLTVMKGTAYSEKIRSHSGIVESPKWK
jgi:hypothetical protein